MNKSYWYCASIPILSCDPLDRTFVILELGLNQGVRWSIFRMHTLIEREMAAARLKFAHEKDVTASPRPSESAARASDSELPKKQSPVVDGLKHLVSQQASLIESITHALDCDSSEQAAFHIGSMLQSSIRSTDVFLAVVGDDGLEMATTASLSNIDARTNELALIRLAMQEAIDQDAVIVYPLSADPLTVTDAHERLVDGQTNTHLMSIPFVHREEVIGAVLFRLSKQAPWETTTREHAKQLCAGVAPVLALHLKASMTLSEHVKRSFKRRLASVVGPTHITLKFLSILGALSLMLMALIPIERTIRADAEITPASLYVISAPASGFIESISVRSGDVVERNQLLLTLDTRELALQSQHKQVEIDRLSSEYRGAMADHDRKAMAIVQAKLNRARAEQELLTLELSRAEVRAPQAGYVIGDALTKATGAPINRGDALVQIAPTTGHEVHLLVDEADVTDVKAGLMGRIALKSSPGEALNIVVDAIRPIAENEDGATRFRVVADIDSENTVILPGQTGVAHIVSEKRSALRVVTWRISRWISERVWMLFG